MDEASVRRVLRTCGYKTYLLPTQDADRYLTEIEKPFLVEGPVAIGGDFHIPLFDAAYVNQAIEHWLEAKCKTLVVAGDFWNEDSLSAFEYKQETAQLQRELREGNVTMTKLLEAFDNIYFIRGNHDARLQKLLGYKMKFAESMRLMFGELPLDARARLHIANLDHCHVLTNGVTYRVAHPKDYSATPCTNARKVAAKYQCNVLLGHSHHTAISPDVSGNWIAAEIGGFFDVEATEYVQRTTSHARWTKGYGFVEADGRFVLESELWSTRR